MGFVFILNSPNCPSVEDIRFLTIWKIRTHLFEHGLSTIFFSSFYLNLMLSWKYLICPLSLVFFLFANSLAFYNAFCDTSLVLSSVLKILYLYLCQLIGLNQQITFSLACAPVFVFVIFCFCLCFSQG